MKEKAYEMGLLFDYYGDLLTAKQRDIFDYYYNEDLSLSEISELLKISRQGVRDALVRAEEVLTTSEARLGIVARFGDMEQKLEKICDLSDEVLAVNNRQFFSPDIDQRVSEIFSIALSMRTHCADAT